MTKFTRTYTITISADATHRPVPCGTKEQEEKQIADACLNACGRYFQTSLENVSVKVEASK